jgi:hypothetical protein
VPFGKLRRLLASQQEFLSAQAVKVVVRRRLRKKKHPKNFPFLFHFNLKFVEEHLVVTDFINY